MQTWFETFCDESKDDYDAFLANSLHLAGKKLGRDVTLEELKQVRVQWKYLSRDGTKKPTDL